MCIKRKMNRQQWLSLVLFLSSLAMTSVVFALAALATLDGKVDGQITTLAIIGWALTVTSTVLILVGTIRLSRKSPWTSRARSARLR
jgi:hypothetical protein